MSHCNDKAANWASRLTALFNALGARYARPLLRVLLLFAGTLTLAAQENPFVIQIWQVHDDLPHNDVRDVLQTRDGYIWVATAGGAGRYSGNHFGFQFDVFHAGNTPAFPNSSFSALAEDSTGALWLGLDTGEIVRRDTGITVPVPLPKAWPRAPFKRMLELSPGRMLALSREGTLAELSVNAPPQLLTNAAAARTLDLARERDGTVWAVQENGLWPLGSATKKVLPGRIDFACAARDGGLWVLSDQRLRRWEQGRMIEERRPLPLLEAVVICMMETRDGQLLVGTTGRGLMWAAPGGEVRCFDESTGLTSDHIFGLCEDHEGSIWVGTAGGGLLRLSPRRAATVTIPPSQPPASLLSVTPGPTNDLWIGTLSAGLFHLTSTGTTHATLAPALAGVELRSLHRTESGEIWLGTLGHGLWRLNGEQCIPFPGWPWTNATVHCLYASSAGRIWAGLSDGLAVLNSNRWERVPDGAAAISDDIRCLAQDPEKNLWFGTSGKGLVRVNGRRVTRFRREEGLGSATVYALLAEPNGTLWAGTQGGGLARIREGRITTITTHHGLVNDTVCQIVDDGRGRLWLATLGGLIAVEKTELNRCADGKLGRLQPLTYDLSDGLTWVDFVGGNQPAAAQTTDGRLWFVTGKGLGVVHLDVAVKRRNLRPPPVIIERVLANEAETLLATIAPGERLRFKPGTERIEFHFNALSYMAPRRVRFQYQLQGVDKDWVDAGPNRTVRFARLPPGDYAFQVRGCNNDAVWNKAGDQLAFSITPHFWQTLWFRASMIMLAVVSVAVAAYAFTRTRHRRKLMLAQHRESLERERGRIARDMHDEVGAKLTRITILSQLACRNNSSPEKLNKSLNALTEVARECVRKFDQIVWTVNPRNDPMEQAANYLAHYAVTFFENTGIECRLNLPDDLPDTKLSATVRNNLLHACEEAMSNVLRHSGARSVTLSMKLEGSALTVVVQDDGNWLARPVDYHDGDGLLNMRQRMADVGGEFSIEHPPGGGTTTVRLRIQLPQTSNQQ